MLSARVSPVLWWDLSAQTCFDAGLCLSALPGLCVFVCHCSVVGLSPGGIALLSLRLPEKGRAPLQSTCVAGIYLGGIVQGYI